MKIGKEVIIVGILTIVIIVFFIMGSGDGEVGADVLDSAYYVESSNNVFSSIAKLCDDAVYYLVNTIFTLIEKILGNFL